MYFASKPGLSIWIPKDYIVVVKLRMLHMHIYIYTHTLTYTHILSFLSFNKKGKATLLLLQSD